MKLSLWFNGVFYTADTDAPLWDTAQTWIGLGDPFLGTNPAWLMLPQASAAAATSQAEIPLSHASASAKTATATTPTAGLHLIEKGFNYVADIDGSYQTADSLGSMVTLTNSNAVALTEDYGIDAANSTVYADYSTGDTTGNTETLQALASTIQAAHTLGLSVMVRPLIDFTADASTATLTSSDGTVYQDGEWRAYYNPTDVAAFFNSYDTMIVAQAKVAAANNAPLFCIGTELDQLTGPTYLSYWTKIISDVRAVYSGKLTYSAISDDDLSPWQYGGGAPAAGTDDITTQVSFWSQLDYVGIDEYAAISDATDPTEQQLVDGWTQTPTDTITGAQTGGQSLIQYYESVATAIGKPLLFTELGYNSAPDAAEQPFFTSSNTYDPTLQTELYQAFFTAWQEDGNSSLQGVYLWNWEPDPSKVGAGTDPSWTPQGNSGALEVLATGFAACYLAGTRIATPSGDIPIEHLTIGGRVTTASGATRKIKWIGWRRYAARSAANNPDLQPILFRAGALADGIPRRDLYVSPKHAMFLDAVLVPAELLINGRTIVQAQRDSDITYLHVELAGHDVLLAEGAPSESFVDCDSRALFDNAAEFAERYPDETSPPPAFCAPRVEAGETVAKIRRRLADRAGLPAEHAADAATEGPPDGRIDSVEGAEIAGWAFDPARPHTPVRIEILADDTVIAKLTANAFRSDLKKAGKGQGRCAFTCRLPAADGTLTLRRATDRAVIALRP